MKNTNTYFQSIAKEWIRFIQKTRKTVF